MLATSIYLSATLYSIALALLVARYPTGKLAFKLIWTAACIFASVHAYLALADVHQWSQSHAFDHIANETERVLGFRFGYGVYFNYLFVLVWLLDVVWLWFSSASYANRSAKLSMAFHLFLILIMVNGAVIFRDGLPRYVGLAVCTALVFFWFTSKHPESQSTDDISSAT